MSELVGRLERVELGSGGYALVQADGARHTLYGDIPANLVGRRVRVEGRSVQATGFLMTGDPAFEVVRIDEAST